MAASLESDVDAALVLEGKVAIVTGSNTGIGKETARELARRGATVIMACRDVDKAHAARREIMDSLKGGDLIVMKLDLGSIASIHAFVDDFQGMHTRLDLLVNNAGLWTGERTVTADGFETTFGVNHLGTFLLTHELLPLLRASAPSRIVVLSSDLHARGKLDLDDLQYEHRKFASTAAYAQSKLANVLFTKALARRLEGTNVTVNAVHPGVVATELIRHYPKFMIKFFHLFLMSPAEGAACSLYVATSDEIEGQSGLYFVKSRSKTPAPAALDVVAQEKLWEESERLLGLEPERARAA